MGIFTRSAGFADTVERLAAKAGLKTVRKNDQHVACLFGFPDGRTQMVHFHPAGEINGHPLVRIATPVAEIPPGQLPAEVADGFLVQHFQFKFGAFGVVDMGTSRLLMLFHNMVLDRLEPDEFSLVIGTLAAAGDTWEQQLGGADRF